MRFINLFNGFTCVLPDDSWFVRFGRGIVMISNREAFILLRFRMSASLKEMLRLIASERLGASKILNIPFSDPYIKEESNIIEIVSVDPSHYYWFISGDDALQGYIFFFGPIPYESITKIRVLGNNLGVAVTYATPIGKMDSYLNILTEIVKSVRFERPELKGRRIDITHNGQKVFSLSIPRDWDVYHFISLSTQTPIFIVKVIDPRGILAIEMNQLVYSQMLMGMGFGAMGQGSFTYDNVSIPFNYIQDITPQKVLGYVLPAYWSSRGQIYNLADMREIPYPELYRKLCRVLNETVFGMTLGTQCPVFVGSLFAEYATNMGIKAKAIYNYAWTRLQLPGSITDNIGGSILVRRIPLGEEDRYTRIIESILSTMVTSLEWTYTTFRYLMNKIAQVRNEITRIILKDIQSEMRHRRQLWEMTRQTMREIHEMRMDSMRKEWEFQRYMANAYSNLLGDTVYVKDEATGEIYHIFDEADEYWIDETGEHILALDENDALLLEQDLEAQGWRRLSKSYGGYKEQLSSLF